MIALYILAALLLIILIIMLLPLAIRCSFGEQIELSVKIGPVKKTLIPKSETPKKKKKEEPAQENQPSAEGEKTKKKKSIPKPTFEEIKTLLAALWRGLKRMIRRMGRHIVLDPVEVYATIGHPDPAMTAELFGYANAAMWTVLPYLQETVRMPHPEVHVRMDFDAPKITVTGEVGLKCRLGGILRIIFGLIGPLLGWAVPFLIAAKKREKMAQKAAKTAPKTAENAPKSAQ